ncbi:ParA family protein [Desulfohalobium retbaense]|uniref:ATPase involved in chromosome partitioning-like protein n=1 Tax=Desulfohalobium retbaense (strain ATCC 49708 / DSM 5692 / JCM 16813 / HR100) TaxID=485915 RepID=C8X5X8_DESRD|nr:AAA family ATPase [Desulfohalobium retbaense]ACV69825.1 ATPase involved in chromosome partitioning-like protein [Desulfohalobium retbaense DSM 5692]
MAKKIALVGFGDAPGTTTNICHTAYVLSVKMGYKTLVVDCDPKCDATLFLDKTYDSNARNNIFGYLMSDFSHNECIAKTNYKNLDVLPGSYMVSTIRESGRYNFNVSNFEDNYDIILFDTSEKTHPQNEVFLRDTDYYIAIARPEMDFFILETIEDFQIDGYMFFDKSQFAGILFSRVLQPEEFCKMYRKKVCDFFDGIATYPFWDSIIQENISAISSFRDHTLLFDRTNSVRLTRNYYRAANEISEKIVNL